MNNEKKDDRFVMPTTIAVVEPGHAEPSNLVEGVLVVRPGEALEDACGVPEKKVPEAVKSESVMDPNKPDLAQESAARAASQPLDNSNHPKVESTETEAEKPNAKPATAKKD